MPVKEARYYQRKRNQEIQEKKADRQATVSAIVTGIVMVAMPFLMVASWVVFGY